MMLINLIAACVPLVRLSGTFHAQIPARGTGAAINSGEMAFSPRATHAPLKSHAQ
jgi:hypothetical protein